MIIDVAATSGGALTILLQYYRSAKEDLINQYYFLVSTPVLEETVNIKVLYYPWVKKSWFHRLFFDKFFPKKLVKKYNIDELLSLQNILYPDIKIKQVVYLHQSLPFSEKKYKITENFIFWVYQNIIKIKIYRSLEIADQVIVQTKWMVDACVKNVGIDRNKILLIPSNPSINVKSIYTHEKDKKFIFFYPANGAVYKNHKIIVDAISALSLSNREKIQVIFTLNINENNLISKLYRRVKEESLPIEFIGHISKTEVYEYYSKSILLFASSLESFGLPLLEARKHKCPIIASNCSFSKEILQGYSKYSLFNPSRKIELTTLIEEFIS